MFHNLHIIGTVYIYTYIYHKFNLNIYKHHVLYGYININISSKHRGDLSQALSVPGLASGSRNVSWPRRPWLSPGSSWMVKKPTGFCS